MTNQQATRLHDVAIERMLRRHPRLRTYPLTVRAVYHYLYPVVEHLQLDQALECIAREAERHLLDEDHG